MALESRPSGSLQSRGSVSTASVAIYGSFVLNAMPPSSLTELWWRGKNHKYALASS